MHTKMVLPGVTLFCMVLQDTSHGQDRAEHSFAYPEHFTPAIFISPCLALHTQLIPQPWTFPHCVLSNQLKSSQPKEDRGSTVLKGLKPNCVIMMSTEQHTNDDLTKRLSRRSGRSWISERNIGQDLCWPEQECQSLIGRIG